MTQHKHKHADLIHAWADGAEIQRPSCYNDSWIDDDDPRWYADNEYRVKPKHTTTETFIRKEKTPSDRSKTNRHETFTGSLTCKTNLRMTWEGETLIKAEVLHEQKAINQHFGVEE